MTSSRAEQGSGQRQGYHRSAQDCAYLESDRNAVRVVLASLALQFEVWSGSWAQDSPWERVYMFLLSRDVQMGAIT